MLKKLLSVVGVVLLILCITQLYFLFKNRRYLVESSTIFYSGEAVLDTGPFTISDVTNAVALVTTLIDYRAEYAIRNYCLEINFNVLPIRPLSEMLNILDDKLLNRKIIRYYLSDLLSHDRDKRRSGIIIIRVDIERARYECLLDVASCNFLGMKFSGVELAPNKKERKARPLSMDEHFFLAILSSHYKAILYEEVEICLTQQAISDGSQFCNEIEALKRKWVQEVAEKTR